MDILQIVLSGASDDEAIGGAQGVPTSTSRGKFESAPVIVSGDPTTIVPAGGAAPAKGIRTGHNWAGTLVMRRRRAWIACTDRRRRRRAPWARDRRSTRPPGTQPETPWRQDMADFDPAHVERGGPPHRYPDGPLLVIKLSVGPYDNNAYLLVDSETRQALLVVLRAHDVWNGAHLADAGEIARQVGVRPDRPLEHGDTLTVGRFEVGVLHTPGHTEGSISFKLPSEHVLTGDAVFPGGVGKTSGREAFDQAIVSAELHVLSLGDDTRISPGHGDDTSVGIEAPHLDEWKARGW